MSQSSGLYQDSHWPRASAWLAGDCASEPVGNLAVIGAPAAKGSITPGRCDLAPAAIRKALERFSTYDCNTRGDVRALRVEDAGDLDVVPLAPEQAFAPIRDALGAANIQSAHVVILLGGDNSITRPGCHGLGVPLNRCGLLTLDAHFDLRDLEAGLTNGNPIRALLRDGLAGDHVFQIGIQPFANSAFYAGVARTHGIHVITADCVREQGVTRVIEQALEHLDRHADRIYVDLDLDVLDRIHAPATPGARPGGLAPHQVRRAAFLCGTHPKVRVLDLVEIDPTRDIADMTTLTAAACVLEFASGVVERLRRD
jgi:formiminoglutamase